MLGLPNPTLSSFIGCTPNYSDQIGPNTYGSTATYQKQPCLHAAGAECRTETNTYASTTVTPNRLHFTSVVDVSMNPTLWIRWVLGWKKIQTSR